MTHAPVVKRKSSSLLQIVRILLAVGCLALLYYFGFLRIDVLASLADKPGRILICLLLLLMTVPVSALRWHLLLRHQGFRLPYSKTLAVTFVGQFFNAFLPGAYGGDLVRAGYVYHGARGHGGQVVLSILIDRVAGFVGLIMLGLIAQLVHPMVIDLRVTLAMIAIGAVLLVGLALVPSVGLLIGRLLARSGGALGERLLRMSEQLRVGIANYMDRWYLLVVAVIISAFQFVLVLVALVVIADAFDFVTLAPLNIVLAGIFSLVASSIPLTPGGLGVGEAAFANAVMVIQPGAVGPYATIFIAMRALILIVSLFGGIVFFFYRSELIDYVAHGHGAPENA